VHHHGDNLAVHDWCEWSWQKCGTARENPAWAAFFTSPKYLSHGLMLETNCEPGFTISEPGFTISAPGKNEGAPCQDTGSIKGGTRVRRYDARISELHEAISLLHQIIQAISGEINQSVDCT